MTRPGARWTLPLLLIGASLGVCAGDGGLRHDPFIRPSLGIAAGPSSATTVSPAGVAPRAEELAPTWQSDLRGVMLAGTGSVANVGGSIVAIGESLDGWRLQQVGDGQALFVKGRKRLLLTMNDAGLRKK